MYSKGCIDLSFLQLAQLSNVIVQFSYFIYIIVKPFATLFLRVIWPLGVNFTNIFWAAFAPKSFCQKITNPNFKHIKAAQQSLVWLSISPIFYEQLFHTIVLYAAFMCLQFGFLKFWQKDFGAKAAHKMLVTLTLDELFCIVGSLQRTLYILVWPKIWNQSCLCGHNINNDIQL